MRATHNSGVGRGSLVTYSSGLILALVLTAVPFWMVMSGAAPASALRYRHSSSGQLNPAKTSSEKSRQDALRRINFASPVTVRRWPGCGSFARVRVLSNSRAWR